MKVRDVKKSLEVARTNRWHIVSNPIATGPLPERLERNRQQETATVTRRPDLSKEVLGRVLLAVNGVCLDLLSKKTEILDEDGVIHRRAVQTGQDLLSFHRSIIGDEPARCFAKPERGYERDTDGNQWDGLHESILLTRVGHRLARGI